MRVLAIGNTIIDTVLSMDRIPTDDKIWIRGKKKFVGGQGANAAQGMARLGLKVAFVTRLGADEDGHAAKRHFESEGMDATHCIEVPDALTMSAYVAVGSQCMTRCCFMHRDEAMFRYDSGPHLDKIDLDEYDVVYTDGHQMDLALPVLRRAVANGIRVVADMEVVDSDTRTLFDLATEVIAPAKVVARLADEEDPAKAVLKLADSSPGKTIVATAGEGGSYGAQHGDKSAIYVPSHPDCKAFDTAGAGDAFHAGYMVASARGIHDLEGRLRFATTVAAALCETTGVVVSLEALARYGVEPVEL